MATTLKGVKSNQTKARNAARKGKASGGGHMTAKPSAKAAKKAPGDATASRAKANDNLKALRANPDVITTVVAANGGNGTVASSAKANVVIAGWQENATTRKLAVVGGSIAALRAHLATLVKPTAKLARGIQAGDAPQSAKAVADQRREAPAPKGKATKPAAPKAAKNKQPSRGVERSYKLGTKANEAKAGTWRHHMLTVMQKHGDTAKAKAAHAKSGKFSSNKLDFNWANAQGYITFTK